MPHARSIAATLPNLRRKPPRADPRRSRSGRLLEASRRPDVSVRDAGRSPIADYSGRGEPTPGAGRAALRTAPAFESTAPPAIPQDPEIHEMRQYNADMRQRGRGSPLPTTRQNRNWNRRWTQIHADSRLLDRRLSACIGGFKDVGKGQPPPRCPLPLHPPVCPRVQAIRRAVSRRAAA